MISTEILVTAGGTQEPLDDVRFITNFSTGELGVALANRYASLGFEVSLLATQLAVDRYTVDRRVNHAAFTSAEDLMSRMLNIDSASLVLHAAAVSDYTPEKVQGKISSERDELIIRLRRTPKILKLLRGHFGESATLVGFKLLSGVSEEELIRVGSKQIQDNSTDYCIANDLKNRSESARTLHVVHRDGSYDTATASTSDLAYFIAQKINMNANT